MLTEESAIISKFNWEDNFVITKFKENSYDKNFGVGFVAAYNSQKSMVGNPLIGIKGLVFYPLFHQYHLNIFGTLCPENLNSYSIVEYFFDIYSLFNSTFSNDILKNSLFCIQNNSLILDEYIDYVQHGRLILAKYLFIITRQRLMWSPSMCAYNQNCICYKRYCQIYGCSVK
jgi:hypothetical protein